MRKNDICAVLSLTEQSDSLRALTLKRPIAALPFASRFRIIDFPLSSVSEAGVKSVALFIGKSGRSIYDHVRSGSSWGFDSHVNGGIFTFSQQFYKYSLGEEVGYEDFYEDLIEFVKRSHVGYVFISGSKVIANVNLEDVKQEHIESGCDITQIFDEGHRNLNKYLLSTPKLYEMISLAVKEKLFVEVDELIRHYSAKETVNTYIHLGYTAIINDLSDYFYANMDMLDSQKFKSLFYASNPVVTKTRNGAPSFFTDDAIVLNSLIATDCVVRGHVERSLLSRRVEVEKDAHVKNTIILQGCHIGKGASIEYAILDKGVQVGKGAVIKGTPDNILLITKNDIIGENEERRV
ncbi:glucose-1-phosphate adenylyltransferase subunit GlgD [Carnobacteriaceae bacterium zg-84]|uniref:glucose-1-phosphate adenylyltransferase subunit GlgD n=1 Tax=Granulicatella sp. zg-84 TaxID=2678503 RepID=UPI0013C05794|nr:glucose-1-phosphate adenylyltransferase subunit GlgD [Granulicatella sp. zg-84]NEW65714.1 glucose-1-phosphate adenylyltransferase subunit GlgD [Granulicatella sp. zg-84]QMI86532.1 glucose-1-phosphate adenylyltransferase subunit GlgD [Carnobacteriaceae bacterium zg-84]